MPTWDSTYEAEPAGTDNLSEGDDRIEELREEIRQRLQTEHNVGANDITNDTQSHANYTDDGRHLPGSARAFVGTAEPTVLSGPSGGSNAGDRNGSDGLDTGRILVRSDESYALYVYDGGWQAATAKGSTTGLLYSEDFVDTSGTNVPLAGVEVTYDSGGASVTIPEGETWDIELYAQNFVRKSGEFANSHFIRMDIVQQVDGGAKAVAESVERYEDHRQTGTEEVPVVQMEVEHYIQGVLGGVGGTVYAFVTQCAAGRALGGSSVTNPAVGTITLEQGGILVTAAPVSNGAGLNRRGRIRAIARRVL